MTSTFAVTNPGNTPLANVAVTDDHCGPVTPVPPAGRNVGDTDPANGLLDPGETWQFTLPRSGSDPASTDPAGQNVVNTATSPAPIPTGTDGHRRPPPTTSTRSTPRSR